VGVYVATTELGFAIATCATPAATVAIKDQQARQLLFDESIALVRSLGAFTILNYEELLQKVLGGQGPGDPDAE